MDSTTFQPDHKRVQQLRRRLLNPFFLRLYLFTKLPAAWFVGLRLRRLEMDKTEVVLPYRWRSKNPFRSIYFAAQCAAAEFSTGILAALVLESMPPTSMLVTAMRAEFLKKANTDVVFTCTDGAVVVAAVERAIQTGEGQTVTLKSVGTNAQGEVVAEMWFTWSFKKKRVSG